MSDADDAGPGPQPCVEGVDGTLVAYRERVHAPWWMWLVTVLLTSSLGIAYGFPLGAGWGLLVFLGAQGLAAWWLLGSAPLLVVDDRVLRAGRARLPLRYVGRIAPLDAEQTRQVRGPRADPAAYLCLRGWVARSVLVEVDDPDDPHPYWLLSTRHGRRLATTLAPARDAAREAVPPSGGPPTSRADVAGWEGETSRTIGTSTSDGTGAAGATGGGDDTDGDRTGTA
ncbi:MAG: DUF3093 family protein [Frankiales bacterium]|nr:DUF3093 family protein [Frankiales bacterium]